MLADEGFDLRLDAIPDPAHFSSFSSGPPVNAAGSSKLQIIFSVSSPGEFGQRSAAFALQTAMTYEKSSPRL